MANQWVDSYLDALLSFGLSSEYGGKVNEAQAEKVDAEKQVYAKYYVQQILSWNEESITAAWLKASSGQLEKDRRLQYLSWRVWGMKRKRAQVLKEIQSVKSLEETEAELERAAAAMAITQNGKPLDVQGLPQLQNGEAEALPNVPPVRVQPALTLSDTDDLEDDGANSLDYPLSPNAVGLGDEFSNRVQKLYVVMISMHGLVRGEKMELGRDPDTGGQVKYVVEVAKSMAHHPAVHRVDLLTRLIEDPSVDKSYGVPEERLLDGSSPLAGAFIRRIQCGNPKEYLSKESLWPHIREFADHAIAYIKSILATLATAGEPCELYVVHGHYADAGEAAALIANTLGVEMVCTGHSLGRNKKEHLLKSGAMSMGEIENTYKISRRIEAEERVLDNAIMVFTSTMQEVKDQWGLYDGYDGNLERAMRFRSRRGRHFPVMCVIPPGLDFSNYKVDLGGDMWAQLTGPEALAPLGSAPPELEGDPEATTIMESKRDPSDGSASPRSESGYRQAEAADAPVWQEIFRFLRNPGKPVVLAMSRPDAKKNITTLVKAFGGNRVLRELANLVLVMGNRDVIDSMAPGSQKVLADVLKLIDAYDLYGSVAYPKHHTQADITDIYLLAHMSRGVFTNIALQEPFGLTLIEAAAHGVPIVATTNGGPVDIVHTLNNGILVNPTDAEAVGDAIVRILTQPELWDEYSLNGKTNILAYSWPAHCIKYLRKIENEKKREEMRKGLHTTLSASLDKLPSMAQLNGVAEEREREEQGVDNADELSVDMSVISAPDAVHMARSLTLPADIQQVLHQANSNASFDDTSLHKSLRGPHSRKLSSDRDAYIIFMLEDSSSAQAFHTLFPNRAAILQAAGFNPNSTTCIGVATLDTYPGVCQTLNNMGNDAHDLDFVISNAGTEIWYLYRNQVGTGTPIADHDESYDRHIEKWWERTTVKRQMVRFLATAPVLKKAENRYVPITDYSFHKDTGPCHLLIEFPRASNLDVNRLLQSTKRRLRQVGIRAQVTLQVLNVSGLYGGMQRHVLLHLTPLRASRALALRYMALHSDLPLDKLVVVTSAGVLKGPAGEELLMFATTGAADMLGGAPRVLVVPTGMAATEKVRADEVPHLVHPLCYDTSRVRIMNNGQE